VLAAVSKVQWLGRNGAARRACRCIQAGDDAFGLRDVAFADHRAL
jgi:hypothetical protein